MIEAVAVLKLVNKGASAVSKNAVDCQACIHKVQPALERRNLLSKRCFISDYHKLNKHSMMTRFGLPLILAGIVSQWTIMRVPRSLESRLTVLMSSIDDKAAPLQTWSGVPVPYFSFQAPSSGQRVPAKSRQPGPLLITHSDAHQVANRSVTLSSGGCLYIRRN